MAQVVDSASEPDISDDDMGLDPLYTPEEIQRIQIDAHNVDTQDPGALPTAPQDQPDENIKKRNFRARMTSEYWEHFAQSIVDKKTGFYTATCNYCGHVFPMGNSKGTGSLKHHIKNACKKCPSSKRHRPDALQKLLLAGMTKGQGVAAWQFDQDKCRKSLAIMVIVHEYPFNCVEHHYFKVFLSDLQPKFKLITRNTLRSDCIKIYKKEKDDLYDLLGRLDCRVSFISDLWTSRSGDRGFMALTCHFIEDGWVLRKRILNFTSLPCPHTCKNIAQAILAKLVLWNLDKKAFSLVLDNASANDACIKELLNGSQLKDVLPAKGEVFHQRCGCHILNLIVQDGLAMLGDEIDNIRDTMKYIHNSQARMENFELAIAQVKAPQLKPIWDVPTRWNSTYTMLELALKLKPAICRYATLDNKFVYNPSELEWEAIGILVDYLKVFYVATMKLSGSKYPTINLYFTEFCEVCLNIKKMETSPYPFVVKMGKAMFNKWDKYWQNGNTLLAIACVFDPRCKLHVVQYYFKMMYPDKWENFIANLKACMNALFLEYLGTNSKQASGSSSQSVRRETSTRPTAVTVSDTRAGLNDFIRGMKNIEPEKSDLEHYLESPLDDTSLEGQFDILAWWKLKVPRYPVLTRLVRDILAVPISTVASEAAFSTSARTLSPARNSLNDESIEALICAQDWLRVSDIEKGVKVGGVLWGIDD